MGKVEYRVRIECSSKHWNTNLNRIPLIGEELAFCITQNCPFEGMVLEVKRIQTKLGSSPLIVLFCKEKSKEEAILNFLSQFKTETLPYPTVESKIWEYLPFENLYIIDFQIYLEKIGINYSIEILTSPTITVKSLLEL